MTTAPFSANVPHPPLRRREATLATLALALAALATACSSGSSRGTATGGTNGNSSVVVPQPVGIKSDGVDAAQVQVELRDTAGQPLPGRPVLVSVTGQQVSLWPAPQTTTTADGRAVVRVTSTIAERKLVTVQADLGNGLTTLVADLPIDFAVPDVARQRASVSSSGAEANDFSGQPAVSGNGRFVAFQSKASNLVAGDSNEKEDVFVFDRTNGAVERVSLTPTQSQFPDLSGQPSLSDDGTLVAFTGRLRDDDDVWVRDRLTGQTQPISAAIPLGGRNTDPSLSGDGRFVAFVHTSGEQQQVYVYDRLTLQAQIASVSSAGVVGDAPSYAPSISRDGRYVAFASSADNLVANDSNEKIDVFVRDRVAGITRLVSRNANGALGNDDSVEAAIAADGSFVAFASKAANLVPGDDNGKSDVFVVDRANGAIERVSVDPTGQEVDKESWLPVLSADGRYVVFASLSDDLVAGDGNGKEDVFRRDRFTGVTVRVSRGLGGNDPNEFSTEPALASDAPVVAFTSKADNLVPSDENDQPDVFTAPRD